LLDWTEVDIWRYIQQKKFPIPNMYSPEPETFSVRSLPVHHASDREQRVHHDEIIAELEATKQPSALVVRRIITNATRCKN